MTSLCPACWRVVSRETTTCPHCGADIERCHRRPFREKLLGALTHPDRDTVVRAVATLAARHDPDARLALETAIHRFAAEPHVVAALLQALAFFDQADAERIAREALGHPSFIVRRAAAQVLGQADEAPCE